MIKILFIVFYVDNLFLVGLNSMGLKLFLLLADLKIVFGNKRAFLESNPFDKFQLIDVWIKNWFIWVIYVFAANIVVRRLRLFRLIFLTQFTSLLSTINFLINIVIFYWFLNQFSLYQLGNICRILRRWRLWIMLIIEYLG